MWLAPTEDQHQTILILSPLSQSGWQQKQAFGAKETNVIFPLPIHSQFEVSVMTTGDQKSILFLEQESLYT
ncbi:hypothetical protein CCR75_001344 [Bremia lactucae]|uniref:Uncharacterized protein n=1 Tax=Bremia lactucae TaxID=4779 RepID=A0A976FFC1_BRELC|nr:hypothetical protein CCR75_001344 [Bremia lactucae]